MIKTRMRLIVAVAAVAATIFALVPAGPASAHAGQIAMQGTATLNSGTLACGNGTLTGQAAGNHGGSPAGPTAASASYSYCNNLADGTASGRIGISGLDYCNFNWVRTGTTASVTLDCDEDGQFDDGSANAHLTVTSAPGAVPGTAQVTAVAQINTHDSDTA